MAVILSKHNPALECNYPKCKSRIGYDADEQYMNISDDNVTTGLGVDCPNCGTWVLTRKVAQTKWPDAFYKFGGKQSVHVGDDTIQRFVNECVETLSSNENNEIVYRATGDVLVVASWDYPDIVVWVCQGYHEAYITRLDKYT